MPASAALRARMKALELSKSSMTIGARDFHTPPGRPRPEVKLMRREIHSKRSMVP